MNATLRRSEPRDADALTRICLLTGSSGSDATGRYSDDRVLGDIYAVPYAVRDPHWAWVVDNGSGARGYLVATPDTTAFEKWFIESWWPERDAVYRANANAETLSLIDGVQRRRDEAALFAETYPAHLHINLLDDLRGGGWGRTLIETLVEQLRAEGVPGLHLVASLDNENAQRFYEKLGFERLESAAGASYGMLLG
ncbi:GNAT family N-acetyltransferase [Microbacterium sp. YY-03]|uniref:GNAT family N-acetyltransferase n=1 Tax=Microbacterium sp. YY-03 TaxID=3421636 RepID=UPI003D181ED3